MRGKASWKSNLRQAQHSSWRYRLLRPRSIDAYEFPDGEQIDNPIRNHWNAFAAEYGPKRLWSELHQRDPESAQLIPPADIKRVVRAFELLETGDSYAIQKQRLQSLPQWVPAMFIGLAVDPMFTRTHPSTC